VAIRVAAASVLALTLLGAPHGAAAGNQSQIRRPPFAVSVAPLDAATRRLMTGRSWRPGCPVPLRDLRMIHMPYWGFDDRWHRGELVIHRRYAASVVRVFEKLYDARFPIRRMRLVDRYGADDHRSMAADNTSGFNCRWRGGVCCTWSQHAYGRAIDLNPVENPYLWSGGVSPPAGRAYLDRSRHRPGMVHAHDRVWWAFHAVGWGWGGTWSSEKDYQRFSANGR